MESSDAKSKLANIQTICEGIYEAYESTTSKHDKLAYLKRLLGYQKAFNDIVDSMADEAYDESMRTIVGMNISFDKIDNYAVMFGGIEAIKKETADGGRERSNAEEIDGMKKAVRRRTEIEDIAYEEYKGQMKEAQVGADLDDDEKRKAVDKLLEDLKFSSGFTVAPQDIEASKFASEFSTRKTDLDKLKQISNEIKKLGTTIKKENNQEKKKQLVNQQKELKKAEGMVLGLRSVYEALFTSRNPIVGFFGRLFGKKYDVPKKGQAVMASPNKIK